MESTGAVRIQNTCRQHMLEVCPAHTLLEPACCLEPGMSRLLLVIEHCSDYTERPLARRKLDGECATKNSLTTHDDQTVIEALHE